MYVRREVHPSVIWFFSKRAVCFFAVLSLVVYLLYAKLKLTAIALPFLPVATIGTAVAFYVGFKNNASYERLWEARKIWAEIEYLCRMWGSLVMSLNLPNGLSLEEKRLLIYRQLARVNNVSKWLIVSSGWGTDSSSEDTICSDYLSGRIISSPGLISFCTSGCSCAHISGVIGIRMLLPSGSTIAFPLPSKTFSMTAGGS